MPVVREFLCYEFVYGVLDKLYPPLMKEHGPITPHLVDDACRNLRCTYGQLSNNEDIDYSDLFYRIAYLYAYAATRACIVSDMIGRYRELVDFLGAASLNVVSIGGGPGTDLIGVTKQIATCNLRPIVSAVVVDGEQSWQDVLDPVIAGLNSYVDMSSHPVIRNFIELLDTDPHSALEECNPNAPALYIMSYCLAEFHNRQSRAESYFTRLLSGMARGSYILFVDINHSDEYEAFDRLTERVGIGLVRDSEGWRKGFWKKEAYALDDAEVRLAGTRYRGNFVGKPPNLTLTFAYRLGYKP